MAARRNEVAELAEQMVHVLEAQRRLGNEAYPLPLKQLAQLTNPVVADALVAKAAGRRDFTARVLVTRAREIEAPVALAGDEERLAASGVLLEYLIKSVSSVQQPLWPVSKLKAKVAPKLRKPFEAALNRQIRNSSLPQTMGLYPVKRSQQLYFKELPVKLAQGLVSTLEAQRRLGEEMYPLPLSRLAQLANSQASAALIELAAAQDQFRERALVASEKNADAPVALVDDQEQLANSPVLLLFLLNSSRTNDNQAAQPGDWKKKVVPALWPAFQEALQRRIDTGLLPAQVCWIRIKKKPYLFLRKDLNAGLDVHDKTASTSETPVPSPPSVIRDGEIHLIPEQFLAVFDQAFQRLDRQLDTHNLVSLMDLRRALPVDRAVFDAGLHHLRQTRHYTLSATEGRHDLTVEERAAGIVEDGTLLLYVSRRHS